MAAKKDKKEEIDPELIMLKKFRAKCRFRAIVRLVIANAYWMIDDELEEEDLDNVKKRVAQAIRSKAKTKQLLSLTDKALLNKPAAERTEHEKKYIYRIIGGLKCFKKYPNHVKKKLAAVTYFKYYSHNRVIVRQKHEAHALYFIVTGDVIVSQLVFDELLHQFVSIDIGQMTAGDMFGEVSLLHNIPRTATCTTSGHCEFLILMKEDFKSVLLASVQKQWDEVRRAMSAFTYFDSLDQVASREGCIVAKLKSYKPNDTILGDGIGVPNFVYFVLSGQCQMIETLQVFVTKHLGQSFYTLYDPFVHQEESEQDFETKYFKAYNHNSKTSEQAQKEPAKAQSMTNVSKLSTILSKHAAPSKHGSVVFEPRSTMQEEPLQPQEPPPSVKRLSTAASIKSKKPSIISYKPKRASIISNSFSLKCKQDEKSQTSIADSTILLPVPEHTRHSIRISVIPEEIRPRNLQTYFMQVCQLLPGATFGFGENMRDRRIVALTRVDCLLLPKVWLLQRNTANIWSRIQHYLEKKIPTKKQLFEEFVNHRRWLEYRDKVVKEVVSRSNTVNWTTFQDVPYSIRIHEMLDV